MDENIVVRVGDLREPGASVARAEAREGDVEVTRDAQMIRIRMPTAEMAIPLEAAEHLVLQIERAMRSGNFEMSSDFFMLKGSK